MKALQLYVHAQHEHLLAICYIHSVWCRRHAFLYINIYHIIFGLIYSYVDIVVYLLYTTSFVTLEEEKNFKSLQSCKYFTHSWLGHWLQMEDI